MYYEGKGLFPINCMEHKGSGYGTTVFSKVRNYSFCLQVDDWELLK